jgi:protein-S-isoprenylcysteine O-methyltransferase Ste14
MAGATEKQPGSATAGVVAPPPLLYLGALLIGLGLDRLLGLPGLPLEAPLRLLLAAGLGVAALAVALPALLGFRRAGTHVEPWKPSGVLVVEGPYRFTRNPMYLGMTLLYLGVAAAAGGLATLLLLAPLLVLVRYGVIGREERYLEARFGQPYRDYKARVRRWI